MYFDRLMSLVRNEVVRTMRKHHNVSRMGLVSSYNSKTHAVKVKFQPEGTESGWIPLTGLAVGNGFGVMSAPNINDQVEVHHHESDHQVARVLTRHWSNTDKVPEVQPGEHLTVHQQGSTIYHKTDGTFIIGGPGYTSTGPVGGGQSGNLSTGDQTGETGQEQQGQQSSQPNGKQEFMLHPDGTMSLLTPNNNRVDNTPQQNHYIMSQPGMTQCIKSTGSTGNAPSSPPLTIPVMLADGSSALTLYAQSGGSSS